MNTKTEGSVLAAILLWMVLGFIVIGIVVMAVLSAPEDEPVPVEDVRLPVVTRLVEPRALRDCLVLPGTVEADMDIDLGPEKGGVVAKILAEKGDAVRAGQELLRLDARVWENQLKQAAIELREAEKDEQRWSELIESGAVSASDFDAVRTRREVAEVALAQAEVNVSHCVVTSPRNGVLDGCHVEVGEHINEGVSVLRVVCTDPVKIVVAVPEQDVLTVSRGSTVAFTVGALSGQSYTGTVTYVAAAADAAGSSFRAEIEVPIQMVGCGLECLPM